MAILEYLEIMIKLDIEEDNSEILEYVLKVAYKFYPMVYEDSKGIMHVGGTKADEEFEYYYNKGEVNFLSYNEYLNDEEIQANIKALNLDVDKFYLLILFITHALYCSLPMLPKDSGKIHIWHMSILMHRWNLFVKLL